MSTIIVYATYMTQLKIPSTLQYFPITEQDEVRANKIMLTDDPQHALVP